MTLREALLGREPYPLWQMGVRKQPGEADTVLLVILVLSGRIEQRREVGRKFLCPLDDRIQVGPSALGCGFHGCVGDPIFLPLVGHDDLVDFRCGALHVYLRAL